MGGGGRPKIYIVCISPPANTYIYIYCYIYIYYVYIYIHTYCIIYKGPPPRCVFAVFVGGGGLKCSLTPRHVDRYFFSTPPPPQKKKKEEAETQTDMFKDNDRFPYISHIPSEV